MQKFGTKCYVCEFLNSSKKVGEKTPKINMYKTDNQTPYLHRQ